MIFFPVCLLLTNHETLYNINILLSFHPTCEPTINHYPLIRLFFSSHDYFCFIKMDFLKAEIIIGLTGINTKYHKHITGHRHSSQGI